MHLLCDDDDPPAGGRRRRRRPRGRRDLCHGSLCFLGRGGGGGAAAASQPAPVGGAPPDRPASLNGWKPCAGTHVTHPPPVRPARCDELASHSVVWGAGGRAWGE
eukprot:5359037-Prymnesium_polylepis.2